MSDELDGVHLHLRYDGGGDDHDDGGSGEDVERRW